jgi:hypothetical protein
VCGDFAGDILVAATAMKETKQPIHSALSGAFFGYVSPMTRAMAPSHLPPAAALSVRRRPVARLLRSLPFGAQSGEWYLRAKRRSLPAPG